MATILRKRRAEPNVVAPVAGRIAIFAANWRLITEDPWVLAVVREGYRLEFLDLPFQAVEACNKVMSPSQQTICDGEVSSMSRKGAVTKVGTANFVSGFFIVPKSSGAWRPILNLKPLNRFFYCLSSL